MQPSGIHLLLTYKCNASCKHCFLSCGPKRKGTMSADDALKYLEDASKAPYINHFFIEGGEPFLYPQTLLAVVKHAADRGYWIGALTNGFWAVSEREAKQVLEPLVESGLRSLGISTDAWHREFVAIEKAELAARVAERLGLEVDLMVCSGGSGEDTILSQLQNDGFDVYPGSIICRGRASSSEVCRVEKNDWRSFKRCPESFGGRSRVHIGPFGQIHLCQGLLLGRDARKESLKDIFDNFNPIDHPVCAALMSGGPAALAELASNYGFTPRASYADGCQLCFEARRHLRPHHMGLIGPDEMYAVDFESVKG